MKWSADGTLLATGGNDGLLRICDPRASLDDPTLAATGMDIRGHLGVLTCVRPVVIRVCPVVINAFSRRCAGRLRSAVRS